MRNWAIAGVVIALLAGSVSSKAVETTYKGVKEVCLFSPTVPPANSALAIQSIGEETFQRPDYGYDFVHDFDAGFAGRAPTASRTIIGSPAIATAAISLRGINEPLRHSNTDGKNGDIPGGTDGDGPFGFRGDARNAEYGSAEYFGPRFKVSGISGAGVERNGFVAGFNFKY